MSDQAREKLPERLRVIAAATRSTALHAALHAAAQATVSMTMYIQQAHLALEHLFCLIVERRYFAQRYFAKAAAPAAAARK
jgi:hypothetical protein